MRKPIIRDETGPAIFGVAPVPILLWATESWRPAEMESIAEFVLVSSDDEATRIEEAILANGGARFGPSHHDSQFFRSTNGGPVCIINIRRDYSKAQRDSRISQQGRARILYSHLKYWVNLHRVILRQANRALTTAKLLAAHHDSTSSVDELWYRERDLQNQAERCYFKKLLTSRLFPASFVTVITGMLLDDKFSLTFHGMERFEDTPQEPPSSDHGDTAMDGEDSHENFDEIEDAPLGDRVAAPESDNTRSSPTKIRNESGEVIAGVDPAEIFAWGLSAFPSDDAALLREIVIVNDESAIDNTELELMLRGAYPIYRRTPKSRTYTLPNGGVILIVNIGRMRQRVIARLQKPGTGWLRWHHLSLAYRTRLKFDVLDELQLGVASAKLAVLRREGALPDSEVDEKYTELYSLCLGPVIKRTCCSTLFPSVMTLICVRMASRLWRGSCDLDRL